MNVVSCIGRIGKDAEMKFLNSGKAVLKFTLAVNIGYGDKQSTMWYDVSSWFGGDKIVSYLTKGKQIGVSGRLGSREYEGKTYLTIDADGITLIGDKSKDEAPNPARTEAAPPPQRRSETTPPDLNDEIPF